MVQSSVLIKAAQIGVEMEVEATHENLYVRPVFVDFELFLPKSIDLVGEYLSQLPEFSWKIDTLSPRDFIEQG